MAGIGNVVIEIDIESISKVTCLATNCQHNLSHNWARTGQCTCNLKHIHLNASGRCKDYTFMSEKVEEEEGEE